MRDLQKKGKHPLSNGNVADTVTRCDDYRLCIASDILWEREQEESGIPYRSRCYWTVYVSDMYPVGQKTSAQLRQGLWRA